MPQTGSTAVSGVGGFAALGRFGLGFDHHFHNVGQMQDLAERAHVAVGYLDKVHPDAGFPVQVLGSSSNSESTRVTRATSSSRIPSVRCRAGMLTRTTYRGALVESVSRPPTLRASGS